MPNIPVKRSPRRLRSKILLCSTIHHYIQPCILVPLCISLYIAGYLCTPLDTTTCYYTTLYRPISHMCECIHHSTSESTVIRIPLLICPGESKQHSSSHASEGVTAALILNGPCASTSIEEHRLHTMPCLVAYQFHPI